MERVQYFTKILHKAKYLAPGPITPVELEECRHELRTKGPSAYRACWGLASEWASADDLRLVRDTIEEALREPIQDEVDIFILGNEALKSIRFIQGPNFVIEYIPKILSIHIENADDMHITAIGACVEFTVDQVKPAILDQFDFFIENDENDILREMIFECLQVWLDSQELSYSKENMKRLIADFEQKFHYKLSSNF